MDAIEHAKPDLKGGPPRWLVGCVLAPFIATLGAIVLGIAGFFVLIGLAKVGWRDPLKTPELPEYAVPAGAIYDNEYEGHCGGSSVDGPPCRTVWFHSNEFESIQATLLSELGGRGYAVQHYRGGSEGESYNIVASSDSNDLCLNYNASPPWPPPITPTVERFNIQVTVYNCSKSGSG